MLKQKGYLMVNFDTIIENIAEANLHLILKKVLNKDSLSVLNFYLKLYKTIYNINNIYFLSNKNTLIIIGYNKQFFSLNNCTANIISFSFKDGNIVDHIDEYFNYEDINRLVSFILNEVFIISEYNKLTIEFPAIYNYLERQLTGYLFNFEGLIKDRYSINGKIFDGKIFSINKSQFEIYSTGYLIHGEYNLKIRATNYAVLRIENFEIDNSTNNDYKNVNLKSTPVYSMVNSAKTQIYDYFKGTGVDFDFKIQLPEASGFQKEVWELCSKIPFGETKSYEDLSKNLKNNLNQNDTNYSRAVGMALSKNPVLLAIPCHRVIGKDGKLRGFSAGIEFKDFLLKHEMLGLWSINNL